MRLPVRQCGFSLVTAIFLLAVLAVLMVNMVNLGVSQQATVVMGVQGARALQAARSGIEFGIFEALNNGNCPPPSPTLVFGAADNGLAGFSVTIACTSSLHAESGSSVRVYELEATATNGNYIRGGLANPDYVSRQIRATVSNNPP